MPAETPKQRFRRVSAKIADSVTIAINVKKVPVRSSLEAILPKVRICCCPLGAVERALTPGIGGMWYPTAPEAAELLDCKEAEASAFIIGFEAFGGLDEMLRGNAKRHFPEWLALGIAYRERFVAAS